MISVGLYRGGQRLFEGRASQVVLPGEEGELSVFDFHASMLCALGPGEVCIDERRFTIAGGLAGVSDNSLTILVS